MGYYLEEEEPEKWYETDLFLNTVAALVLGVAISILLFFLFVVDGRVKEERISREQIRDSAIANYFGSENFMLNESSFGRNRYEVLTEKGLFVVELNEERDAVVKALPISK